MYRRNPKASVSVCLLCLLFACDRKAAGREYHAHFRDAGGLQQGANVYVAGVRVGRVDTIELEGDAARVDRARVSFTLARDAKLEIHQNARVSVRLYGIEAGLRLDPGGPPARVLPPGGELLLVDEGAAIDKVGADLVTIVGDLVAGRGTVGRLLRDEELARNVQRFFGAPSASVSSPCPPAGADSARSSQRPSLSSTPGR